MIKSTGWRAECGDKPRFFAYRTSCEDVELPHDANGREAGKLLCTIEGMALVAVSGGAPLPSEQIENSVLLAVDLTPVLLEQIDTVSAQARFMRAVIESAGETPNRDRDNLIARRIG